MRVFIGGIFHTIFQSINFTVENQLLNRPSVFSITNRSIDFKNLLKVSPLSTQIKTLNILKSTRIIINIQVAQYHLYNLTNRLYLSWDTTTAIILLNTSNPTITNAGPYNLRQFYAANINREIVFLNTSLLTVNAISAHSSQLRYSIINDKFGQFVIDPSRW